MYTYVVPRHVECRDRCIWCPKNTLCIAVDLRGHRLYPPLILWPPPTVEIEETHYHMLLSCFLTLQRPNRRWTSVDGILDIFYISQSECVKRKFWWHVGRFLQQTIRIVSNKIWWYSGHPLQQMLIFPFLALQSSQLSVRMLKGTSLTSTDKSKYVYCIHVPSAGKAWKRYFYSVLLQTVQPCRCRITLKRIWQQH